MPRKPGDLAAAPFSEGGVRGFLHHPPSAGRGLVLTHGAGSDCAAPVLVAAAEAFADAGVAVLRCDLPFRQRRRTGPPSPAGAAEDRAGLREAVAAMREIVRGRIALGGHSYGGRQASMLAAEETEIAAALLLLSYPLHPPKKPAQARTAHFPALRVPAVFVHGERDPFGTPDELREAVAAMRVAPLLITVPGAAHDLRRGRIDWQPVQAALGRLMGA